MEENPRHLGEMVDHGLRTAVRMIRRLAYVGFALAAFALVLLGKIDTRLIDGMRAVVADATVPALDVFSYPLAVVHDVLEDVQTFSDLRGENQRLREENARLAQLRLAAHRLRQENESLRRLLRFDPGPEAQSIAARVVADTGGVFSRSVMVHVGYEHGVRAGLPVIGASGLVGRVQSVGSRSARVLLIADLNSKVPVAIGEGRLRAIMSGRNDPTPVLEFFSNDGEPATGALVVTSGDGGMFHPGLPIGVVERAGGNGWRVRPFVDWKLLDYVHVVDYGMPPVVDVVEERRKPL